ncbi:MAG: tRNA pseudouridine(55) synthase TruB [Bacteroidetes bacterium]|jgi:tRNA pseudouridine55 synthase|nr:tRNA pseudouridine(55) synthase TruB [Bacteroidota bacterium]
MYLLEKLQEGQVILIDKPLRWTSFQVVNKMRYTIQKKYHIKKIKIGHAGTLDPLATGLLIMCTGKFTKKIEEFQGLFKEYTGTFTLGKTTPSYDLETDFDGEFSYTHITEELLNNTVSKFIGEIDQVPPVFSAIQKDGKRAYDSARKGKELVLDSRKVMVYEFEITNIDLPNIDFRIKCGKGTYIRSIANDFGKALNTGAYLSSLRRTKIGQFEVENAKSLDVFLNEIGYQDKSN